MESIKAIIKVINGAGPLAFVLWGTVIAVSITVFLTIAIPFVSVVWGILGEIIY